MAVLLPSKPENLQNTSHFHPVTQHNGFSEKLCQRLLLLFWRLCCVTRTPPAAVSGHLSPLGAHLRQGDTDPWYERKTRGCRGREKVERNTETARDARRTPSALFNPKPEPLVAQHDTEGGRFASVLQTTRVANSAQPSPHITVPLHIPRTPFSLALTALFVSDSKGVLLCCVASLFPPFLFGREGTQRWTGSSRPNARRNLFEPLTTSPDTWTTGGSAERSMGAAFGLRALTHLSRPPQAIRGFVRLGFAFVCIRQVRS